MRKLLSWLKHTLALSRRFLTYLAVVLLAYLVEVSVMPHIRIGTVSPNFVFAVIAVITVCYGRMRAYWTGAMIGILMETTAPTLSYLNLLLYPIVSVFAAVFFADKSEKRLEEERSRGRDSDNGHVYLRTLGDAALCMLLNEAINIVYMYLGGAEITLTAIGRGLIAVVSTVVITAVIMIPLRALLGFQRPQRRRRNARGGRWLVQPDSVREGI